MSRNPSPFDLTIKLDATQNNKSRFCVACEIHDAVHAIYGPITITKADLKSMLDNFHSNAVGLIDERDKPVLQFDFRHDENAEAGAAGWIVDMELSEDKSQLFVVVEWTKEGLAAIKDKRFRFCSPAIVRDFVNVSNNKKFDVVLKGAGLTNVPFLKNMGAVTALDEKKREQFIDLFGKMSHSRSGLQSKRENMSEKIKEREIKLQASLEEIMRLISELSDSEQREVFVSLKQKFGENKEDENENENMENKTDMKDTNMSSSSLVREVGDLKKTVLLTQKKLFLQEKETGFMKLLSDGKVVPAQKDAFITNDLVKFAELSQKLNLDEKGSGKTPEKLNKDQAEDKLILLAEDVSKKEKIPFDHALKQIYSDPDNSKLVQLIGD